MTSARKTFPAAALLALAATAVAEPPASDIYRWTDQQGETHYSDRPPPGIEAEAVNLTSKPATPALSYATRKAARDFPVVLYTVARCARLCEEARDLLKNRQVPFTETRIDTETDEAAFHKRFGNEAEVPLLTVGTTPLSGLEPVGWNQQLDLAGYPKK